MKINLVLKVEAIIVEDSIRKPDAKLKFVWLKVLNSQTCDSCRGDVMDGAFQMSWLTIPILAQIDGRKRARHYRNLGDVEADCINVQINATIFHGG